VKRNRIEEELYGVDSAGRRQFLRNAIGIGGAAALLLTAAGQQTLAEGLALSREELQAARKARGTPGARYAAKASASGAECNCESCTGTCSGGCTSCQGCQGTCSNTSK